MDVLYQTIEELTELCSKQAAIIRRQAAALAQLGAELEEDDHAEAQDKLS